MKKDSSYIVAIAACALVAAICLSANVAAAQNDMSVGEKETIGGVDVKVDKGSDGSTTIRPDSDHGPSITVKPEPNTPQNPSGGGQATGGYTWEW